MLTDKLNRLKICFPDGSAGSSPAIRTIVATTLLAVVAGCYARDDPNRTDITVIGQAPRLGDPDRETLDVARSALVRETAMGLVAFDASGQIEPALAESWIVTDDGRSIVFRIHRMNWRDGSEVTGADVAASLNRAIAANSANRLKPMLSAIDAVVGMTGRVVEIRLKAPRPTLLQLLAQPELGIRRKGTGLGPWRISSRSGDAVILHPVPDAVMQSAEEAAEDKREVYLKGGRAALGVARFLVGRSDLVLGGTLADWPIVMAADVNGNRLRRDPVEGLFGLAIVSRADFLKEKSLRAALSMAIDRAAVVDGLALSRWAPTERLLPAQMDSAKAAAAPDWASATMDERRSLAQQRIASWKSARGAIVPVRVALPSGPGMRVLFAHLAADWRRIGVSAVLVPFADKDADLRLVDDVAPNSSANWYLTRVGCEYGVSCSESGDFALKEARAAGTLNERARAIGIADELYATHGGYIALGKPLRWSLVSAVLTRYRDNQFGAHPFAQLRISERN